MRPSRSSAATAIPASTRSSACTETRRSSRSSRAPARSSASSWAGRSPDYRSDSDYPVGVNEKASTTKAAINNSHATTGTTNPAAASCGEEGQHDRDNRDDGRSVLDEREAQLSGALARTRLIVASRGAEDLHVEEHDDRDGARNRRQGENPVHYSPGMASSVARCAVAGRRHACRVPERYSSETDATRPRGQASRNCIVPSDE